MASLRLCFFKSLLKNKTRVKANNFSVVFWRANHTLNRNQLMSVIDHNSPKLFSNLHKYWLVCRLEHGFPAAKNDAPVINNTSQISKPLQESSQAKQVLENNPGTGITSESKGVSENLTLLDDSLLPPIPDSSIQVIEEASLKSLGLGGWSPPGIIQQILEFFHVSCDVPWWAAIVGLTITLRIFMIPFTIKMRKDMINYSNNVPEYYHLQNKLTEARNSGSYYEVAQASQEINQFFQQKKLFSLGMAVPYFIQIPIFISVYLALKRMSETPELRSFETGGILWFTDLSVPDQFYILPLITAGTVWLTLKYGSSAEAMKATPEHVQKLLRLAVPGVIFLFTMNFPAATTCYWSTTNFFVLLQSFILTRDSVRKYLKIPLEIKTLHPLQPAARGKPAGGIIEGFKESYNNMKLARELEDRERLNAIRFEKNSSAPVRRTFKFNPKEIPNVVQSKQKK